MSDEALRRSERRWRGGADAEGLARHLLAQVRAGAPPAEAARVAERLAAGETTVDDVALAGLGGHGLLPLIPSRELRAIAVGVLARPMLGEGSP